MSNKHIKTKAKTKSYYTSEDVHEKSRSEPHVIWEWGNFTYLSPDRAIKTNEEYILTNIVIQLLTF